MHAENDQASSLLGRRAELDRLEQLRLDLLRGEGGHLQVWGPPGSGKTALVAQLDARGLLPLAASCDPQESGVRGAVLHQLTAALLHPTNRSTAGAPFLDVVSRALADPRARAEDTASALHGVLQRLSSDRPCVLVVDDLEHADAFSADVLHHLGSADRRWGLLVAGRGRPTDTSWTGGSATSLELGPLGDEDAFGLVEATVHPDASPTEESSPARTRRAELVEDVVSWGAGNPGVLVRAARAVLTPDLVLHDSVVDPRRRAAAAAATLWLPPIGLSSQAQTLGLLWAVAAEAPGRRPDPPLPDQLVPHGPLRELLDAGLLVEDGSVVPVHPLLSAAVLELVPSRDVRRAHAVLARAQGQASSSSVWHHAMATPSADDDLADQLERGVTDGTSPIDRARVMELAAALSVGADAQALRWVGAAEARLAAGQTRLAVAAAHRVGTSSPASARSRALLLEGRVATSSRTAQEGFELMLKASETSSADALAALTAAAEVAWWAGRSDWAAEAARRVTDVTVSSPAQVTMVEAVLGGAAAFSGDLGTAGRHLQAALEAARSASTSDHHRLAGEAALLLGDDLSADLHLTAALDLSRSSGDVSQRAFTLQMLASVKTWMGRIDHADALLAEGRPLARRTRDERSHAFELTMSAHLQGLRGSAEDSVSTAGAALQLVTGHDVGYLPASAVWAMGRADLARGRLASALAHLEEATSPDSSRADPVAALFAVPDLVEAASRHGRPDAARPGLARFEAWAEAGSPWARSVLPRLRALLAADDVEAERWYVAAGTDLHRPFERARTQLLHGEHLRRSRQRVRARALLEEARATFDALQAVPWAERAATELDATAETARRGPESALELTPQELRVAHLVAAGASNGEVAEQLFVSRKTVESHLHKIYTKLAIGSRKHLAGALPPED